MAQENSTMSDGHSVSDYLPPMMSTAFENMTSSSFTSSPNQSIAIHENLTSSPVIFTTTEMPSSFSTSTSAIISTTTPSSSHHTMDHLCKNILYTEIPYLHIRLWDWLIFLPNMIFLIYLIKRFRLVMSRLRSPSTKPIIVTFFGLVFITTIASLLRCLLSMVVNAASPLGDITDRIFWVLVRFFLLSTEISVVVFGLAFSRTDSRTAVRRILVVTFLVSLIYSSIQGSLEMIAPDENFYVTSKKFFLFAHGGSIFWMCTCTVFGALYLTIACLPWIPILHDYIELPRRKSFYAYAYILSAMSFVQAVGSAMYYKDQIEGLCIVDVTTYLYFTLFTPLVYVVFLSHFVSSLPPPVMFSYKPQQDGSTSGLSGDSEGRDGTAINDAVSASSDDESTIGRAHSRRNIHPALIDIRSKNLHWRSDSPRLPVASPASSSRAIVPAVNVITSRMRIARSFDYAGPSRMRFTSGNGMGEYFEDSMLDSTAAGPAAGHSVQEKSTHFTTTSSPSPAPSYHSYQIDGGGESTANVIIDCPSLGVDG